MVEPFVFLIPLSGGGLPPVGLPPAMEVQLVRLDASVAHSAIMRWDSEDERFEVETGRGAWSLDPPDDAGGDWSIIAPDSSLFTTAATDLVGLSLQSGNDLLCVLREEPTAFRNNRYTLILFLMGGATCIAHETMIAIMRFVLGWVRPMSRMIR